MFPRFLLPGGRDDTVTRQPQHSGNTDIVVRYDMRAVRCDAYMLSRGPAGKTRRCTESTYTVHKTHDLNVREKPILRVYYYCIYYYCSVSSHLRLPTGPPPRSLKTHTHVEYVFVKISPQFGGGSIRFCPCRKLARKGGRGGRHHFWRGFGGGVDGWGRGLVKGNIILRIYFWLPGGRGPFLGDILC